ncbi:hypothetical protein PFISCL1PPCAC_7081, partial [Pristionchus fissidentatus]
GECADCDADTGNWHHYLTMEKLIDTVIKLLTDSLVQCTPTYNSTDGNPIPHSKEFLRALPLPSILALALATTTCLATVGLAALQIMYISAYVTHNQRRSSIIYLASSAPFISLTALVALFMPRVWFFSHLSGFMYFTIALWVIINLLLNLFEGRRGIQTRLAEQKVSIETSTPPFCCFFPCMPKLPADLRTLGMVEWMVKQTPLVRLLATVVSLMIYFEYTTDGFNVLKVIDFLALPSLLIGIYGTHILVTTVSRLEELSSYRYVVVFRLLDIFIAFFGIQHAVFDFFARAGAFGCGMAHLPPLETAFFWKNVLVTIESFLVVLLSTILLQPSRSAFFDKHPSCRNVQTPTSSTVTKESLESVS